MDLYECPPGIAAESRTRPLIISGLHMWKKCFHGSALLLPNISTKPSEQMHITQDPYWIHSTAIVFFWTYHAGACWENHYNSYFDREEDSAGAVEALFLSPFMSLPPHAHCTPPNILIKAGLTLHAPVLRSAIISNVSCVNDQQCAYRSRISCVNALAYLFWCGVHTSIAYAVTSTIWPF